MKSKFMQTLDDPNFSRLVREAKRRGITMQELIRVVIVPNWLRQNQGVFISLDSLQRWVSEKGLNGQARTVSKKRRLQ